MSASAPSNNPLRWWALRAGLWVLAASLAWRVADDLRSYPRTDDAEVRADVAGVAAQVGGTITGIPLRDNQVVSAGDVLLELDARPYRAERDRAAARLEMVRLEVQALRSAIAQAEAAVVRDEALAAYAAAHFQRMQPLLKQEFFSPDRVQKAEAESVAAAARLAESRAALDRARSELGDVDGTNVRINEAAAELADAEIRLSFCTLTASSGGRVTDLQLAPGAYAAAGEQLFSIVDDSRWSVLANFRETDLEGIQPGADAVVFLMGAPGLKLRGKVEGIAAAVSPLTGPSAAQAGSAGVLERVRPTFDFIQLAARFPVRIALDPDDVRAHREVVRMGGRASVIVRAADRSGALR